MEMPAISIKNINRKINDPVSGERLELLSVEPDKRSGAF